ncbi:MAG: hypothetical protein IT383_12620 [Deltaproteobacteria bacterium]|nr:hypothetical protein [Deltaproteobacteria bacterium]
MTDTTIELPATPMQLFDPARGSARPGARLVRARRHGRVAASIPLFVGFLLLALDALANDRTPAVFILMGAWLAAGTVYLAVLAGSWLVRSSLPPSELARELGKGSSSERNALMLPLIGVALVGPLSLHGAISLLLGCGPGPIGFDEWVMASLIIVGHAHLVFAFLVGRHATMLAEDIAGVSAKRTFLLTTLTSAIPGVLLYAIPPVLTAITGAVLVLPMYGWARRTLAVERVMAAR